MECIFELMHMVFSMKSDLIFFSFVTSEILRVLDHILYLFDSYLFLKYIMNWMVTINVINGRNYIPRSSIKFIIMIKRCFSGGSSAINHNDSSMVDPIFIPIFAQFYLKKIIKWRS